MSRRIGGSAVLASAAAIVAAATLGVMPAVATHGAPGNPEVGKASTDATLSLTASLTYDLKHSPSDIAAISATDAWSVGLHDTHRASGWARHWDGSTWTHVKTPVIPGAAFEGVAANTSSDVWAVGEYEPSGGTGFPESLTEHWDGAGWHQVNCPRPGGFNELLAVSAVSSQDVWAVGVASTSPAQALIEHWDGVSWTVFKDAAPHGEFILPILIGVTALASDDVYAVGVVVDHNVDRPLIEHWDGTAWSLEDVTAPKDSHFYSVDASNPNDVWAVGVTQPEEGDTHGFLEHFDGTDWTISKLAHEPPASTFTDDVVAISPDDAWVVGSQDALGPHQTLTEHWDGDRWSKVTTQGPSPASNSLFAVTASSPDDVLATGDYVVHDKARAFTVRWDGIRWILVR